MHATTVPAFLAGKLAGDLMALRGKSTASAWLGPRDRRVWEMHRPDFLKLGIAAPNRYFVDLRHGTA
jgi:hypothetical protein